MHWCRWEIDFIFFSFSFFLSVIHKLILRFNPIILSFLQQHREGGGAKSLKKSRIKETNAASGGGKDNFVEVWFR